MLVLISFALVLVATVLLVLGLLADSGIALIYVSIACSVLAGIVLFVATRMNRQQAAGAAAGGGSAPVGTSSASEEPTTVAAAPAPTPMPAPAPAPAPAVVEQAAFAPTTALPDDDVEDDADFFPIADYDELRVSEITPLLAQLYADELDVVDEKEREGKARVTILNQIGELRERLAGAPADATAADLDDSTPAGAWEPEEEEEAPARARKAAAKKRPAAKKAAAKKRSSTRR